MKLSHLDYLSNPLRSDHPFGKCVAKEAASASEGGSGTRASANAAVCVAETWSPKEMALFMACICQFGKRFDQFVPLVS